MAITFIIKSKLFNKTHQDCVTRSLLNLIFLSFQAFQNTCRSLKASGPQPLDFSTWCSIECNPLLPIPNPLVIWIASTPTPSTSPGITAESFLVCAIIFLGVASYSDYNCLLQCSLSLNSYHKAVNSLRGLLSN